MVVHTLRRLWPSTLLCALVVALSLALPLPQHGKILGIASPCMFQRLFHLPCPGCGLTRAFVATAHGHVAEALHWHPLGPLLFGLTLGYTLWSLWAALNRASVRVPSQWQYAAGGLIGVLMLACWGFRLAGYFPLALT